MRLLQAATLVIGVVMVSGAPRVGEAPPVEQSTPLEKKMAHVEDPPALAQQWPCQMACPDIYRPVCGIDESGVLKTFPSLCDLELTKCERKYFVVVREGEC